MSTPAAPPVETAADADLSGRQVGDYRVLRRLGRGGMAEVYLAEQCSLQRHVALKVLRGGLAADETCVKRFHQEAQSAAALVHANIVQIYEVGRFNGLHYIAQEYVQGQNLREYLLKQGPPDVRLAVAVMRQVAAALFRASQRGIVHRDIKPENVLLTRSGEVKVADFGLARAYRDNDAVNLTQVGVTMGTPLYMSPEQVEGRQLDHRSDLYSLGVTAYHMLTGAPPFRGETALSVAVQHLKSQPERLENARPDLPTALCRIVHRLLEKDPSRRYNSARELLRDLRAVPIEGLDQPAGDEDLWDAIDEEITGRLEATQKLDGLMKTAALELRDKGPLRPGWLVVGVLSAALVGGAAALLTRPQPVTADASSAKSAVPVRATAKEQYEDAVLNDTPEHWRAVVENFPADTYEVNLAKKELAYLALRQNDFESALYLFDEFANMESAYRDFRAFGLAGQCVVYTLQQRYEEARKKEREVDEELRRRLDDRMRVLFARSAQKTRRELREEDDDWIRNALEELPGPGAQS
jgi:serine/threonine-protein kinase